MEKRALSIQKLKVTVKVHQRVFDILDHIDLDLDFGEHLALVGESGCGKSILAAAVLGLLPENALASGVVRAFGYENLLDLPSHIVNGLRGRTMILIPQNPQGSLNPLLRVGTHLMESLRRNGLDSQTLPPTHLLSAVGVANPAGVIPLFPHQISGGMAQRVVAALGLIGEPEIVIADEPTKGLETMAAFHILELLRTRFASAAMLVITHDLRVASVLPHTAVMYSGEIVELAESKKLFQHPLHPYTQGLIKAHPAFGLLAILGTAPSPASRPPGCRFSPRCALADALCLTEHPMLKACGRKRWVRCFHVAC